MKERKEAVIRTLMFLLFLFVILGVNVARHYDRTFYACGPADFFSLDRGSYEVLIDTREPAAESCRIYYETNGQERILIEEAVKSGVGGRFGVELPSNIRNDSVRSVLLDASGTELPQIDVMRITRILPVRQTAVRV